MAHRQGAAGCVRGLREREFGTGVRHPGGGMQVYDDGLRLYRSDREGGRQQKGDSMRCGSEGHGHPDRRRPRVEAKSRFWDVARDRDATMLRSGWKLLRAGRVVLRHEAVRLCSAAAKRPFANGVDKPIVKRRPITETIRHRPATLKSKRTESLLSATWTDSMSRANTST